MLFKFHRSPRFMNEKRKQFDAFDQSVHIRGKRHGHNLPNNWDDINRTHVRRSWKAYRKTQYR
jgi:hypothetical protein